MSMSIPHIILFIVVPVLFVSTVLYVFLHQEEPKNGDKKYQVRFKLRRGKFQIENIKRGASIIGSAEAVKQKVLSIIFYSILVPINFVVSYTITRILNLPKLPTHYLKKRILNSIP